MNEKTTGPGMTDIYYQFEYWSGYSDWRALSGDYGKCTTLAEAASFGQMYIADQYRWRIVKVTISKDVVQRGGHDDDNRE